jgi:hypothetical protein
MDMPGACQALSVHLKAVIQLRKAIASHQGWLVLSYGRDATGLGPAQRNRVLPSDSGLTDTPNRVVAGDAGTHRSAA